MPKECAPRCSRCKSPVGKDFIYRDDIKMVFHQKCWEHSKKDMINKRLSASRKSRRWLQDGIGSKR